MNDAPQLSMETGSRHHPGVRRVRTGQERHTLIVIQADDLLDSRPHESGATEFAFAPVERTGPSLAAVRTRSLVSQGRHGVDTGGAPGGDHAGSACNSSQEQGDDEEKEGVARAHPVKSGGKQPGERG